jgi:excisionase family DNA binding protein
MTHDSMANLRQIIDNVEKQQSLKVLGAPDGSLLLSPEFEPGHIFIGHLANLTITFDFEGKERRAILERIEYWRSSGQPRGKKPSTFSITFDNPPGSGLEINGIRKDELTMEETAAVLNISLRHLFRLISAGELKSKKKGKRKVLSTREVLQWAIRSGRLGGGPFLIG